MNRLTAASALLIACLSSGCTGQAPGEALDDESVAEAHGALIAENALLGNALLGNALLGNALLGNALLGNALGADAMTAIQDPTASGDSARSLMKYIVSCALDSSSSFDFSWTDAAGTTHDESYSGLLGLAPEWATGPLVDETHERMMSGCLAARVNYYGESVIISVRSSVAPLQPACGSPELAQYSHVEGAFWGNLFADTPYLNACYHSTNVTLSRQAKRDCAVGHLDGDGAPPVPCGMITLRGSCSTWCQSLGSRQYYPSCVDRPGVPGSPMTSAVITTALP